MFVFQRLKGLDINASITFDELKTIRKARDSIFEMRQHPVNKNNLSDKQKEVQKIFGKSIAIKKDLIKGEKICISNLTLKKPGKGFNEKFLSKIVNKTAKKNLSSKRILMKGDFE